MQRTVTTTLVNYLDMVDGKPEILTTRTTTTDEKKLEKAVSKALKHNVTIVSHSTDKALYILDDEIFFKYARRIELDENGQPVEDIETEE